MSSSRRLPIVLDVPSPCDLDWEDMVGEERGRFCGRCGKTVTNLSVLDADEVRAVLARGDCVSFLYRDDASVVTAPSRAGQGTGTGATAAAVVLAATMALTLGCDATGTSDESPQPNRVASEAADDALESRDAAGNQGKQGGATTTRAEAEALASAPAASANTSAHRAPDSVPIVTVDSLPTIPVNSLPTTPVKQPVEPVPGRLRRTIGVLAPGF